MKAGSSSDVQLTKGFGIQDASGHVIAQGAPVMTEHVQPVLGTPVETPPFGQPVAPQQPQTVMPTPQQPAVTIGSQEVPDYTARSAFGDRGAALPRGPRLTFSLRPPF